MICEESIQSYRTIVIVINIFRNTEIPKYVILLVCTKYLLTLLWNFLLFNLAHDLYQSVDTFSSIMFIDIL